MELSVETVSSFNFTMYFPGIAFLCWTRGAARAATGSASSREVYIMDVGGQDS